MQLALKWHGGKYYMASEIVALMPPHLHYVEPYFGGGAVLFERDPEDPRLQIGNQGVSEVVNDINARLISFWRVLRDPELFAQFYRKVQCVPMARQEWVTAHDHDYGSDRVDDAVAFFVDARQSLAGRMKGFTAVTRNRTRRKMNGNVSEWLTSVDGLPDVHERLRRVLIENMPAIDLIRREDTPTTLFYCDPPYLHETRSSPNTYAYEMTVRDHQQLLEILKGCKGKVMLSAYPSELYLVELHDWNRYSFDKPNNAAGGNSKRRMTELVFCNF
jgi:DNA adenine methylase